MALEQEPDDLPADEAGGAGDDDLFGASRWH
jgi:hypothetical protein